MSYSNFSNSSKLKERVVRNYQVTRLLKLCMVVRIIANID